MVNTSQMTTLPSGNSDAASKLWKGTDVLLMTIAIMAGMLLGVAALLLPFGLANGLQAVQGMGELPVAFTVGVLAVQAIVMLAAVWLLGLTRRRYSWADIGLRPTTPGWVAASVGIFIALRLLVVVIALILAQLGITSMQAQALAPSGFTWFGAIGTLLFGGIVVPIAEEVFFRGVVYRWLRDNWGVAVGAIVSGIVFGMAHFELATVIPAILLGIALALVYERSKSLWPSIIIHALNNTSAIVLLYLLLAFNVPFPGVS